MSDEQESLSDIVQFGSKAPTAQPAAKGEQAAKPAEAAPPAATEPAAKAEGKDASRDDMGRFTKAEEKPAEKPQEKPRADVAAIIDERRKRQALEQELAQLRQQAQAKPVEKPSVFENEDAAIRARMDEHSAPVREAIYKLSVKTARTLYKDFDEAAQAFADASERDPRLIAGLQSSDDPGEYIYTMGVHVRELADVGGDLMKYRDKVTTAANSKIDEQAKQIAALTAEIEGLKKAQADLENVPRSLNSTSSGPAPKPGDEDDDRLDNIVRFGKSNIR